MPDQLLAKALIAKGFFTEEQLDQVISTNRQSMTASHQEISGLLYRIDRRKQSLLIQESLSLCTLAEIELYDKDEEVPKFEPSEWLAWGNGIGLLGTKGELEQWLDWSSNAPYGLITTGANSYLYSPNLGNLPYLAVSQQFLYGLVPYAHEDSKATAFDLYFSPQRDYLFVTNRYEGTVHIINTTTYEKEDVLAIREPGSHKAINLSFDREKPIVFLTDQTSPHLYTWNMQTKALEDYEFAADYLGNHVVDNQGHQLLVLAFTPEPHLLALNLDHLEVEQMLTLESQCFSQNTSDPCDLMTLTLENDLVLLSYLEKQTQKIPVLNIIDLKQCCLKAEHVLKSEYKPALLAHMKINPIFPYKKVLGYLLLEANLIESYQLAEIEDSIPSYSSADYLETQESFFEEQEQSTTVEPPLIEPTAVFDLPMPQSPTQTFHTLNALPSGYTPVPDPHHSRLFLINQNRFVIWQLTASQTMLKKPQDFIFVNEQIFFVDSGLQQVIECQKDGTVRWVSNIELAQPSKVTAYLKGQEVRLLVVDTGNHRIIEINQKNELICQFGHKGQAGKRDFYLNAPQDVQYTPQDTVLIADTGNHRVLEIQGDQIIHEVKQFNKPVFVWRNATGSTLVVDSGTYQIMEFDTDWKIINSCHYYYPGLHERYKIPAPTKVIVKPDNHVMIIDQDRLLEISLWRGHHLWFSFLEDCFFHTPDSSSSHFELSRSELLKQLKLFEELSAENIQLLAEKLVLCCFQAGEYIFQPKEEVIGLYFISRGKVDSLNQKGNYLMTFTAGDILGEMNLLNAEARSTYARAKTYCELYRLNKADLEPLLTESNELIQRVNQLKHVREEVVNLKQRQLSGEETKLKQLILSQKKQLALLQQKREQAKKTYSSINQLDESLSSLALWLIEPTVHEIHCINREGKILKTINRLKKPQFVFEKDETILVTDSQEPAIYEIDKSNLTVLHKWGKNLGLKSPRSAIPVAADSILITDAHQIWEVNTQDEVLWSSEDLELYHPHYAEYIKTDHLLVVETHHHVIKEINQQGRIVWSYGTPKVFGKGYGQLFLPEYATRLESGATLIADTQNHRLIEVDRGGNIIWEYSGSQSLRLIRPVFFKLLTDEHIMIYFDNFRQMIEINRNGQIFWSYKQRDTEVDHESLPLEYSEIEQGIIDFAHANKYTCFEIHLQLHPKCKMKSVRISLILSILEKLGTVIKTYPVPEQLLNEELDDQFALSLLTQCSQEQILDDLLSIAEVENVSIVNLLAQ